MLEKSIETKNLGGFKRYIDGMKRKLSLSNEELRNIFISSSIIKINHRKGTDYKKKKFYDKVSKKISSMTYNNIMGNEYKYDVSKQEIRIILMDIIKMMEKNSKKLKLIDFKKFNNKNDRTKKYTTDIYSILEKMIKYMIFQISNENYYLGEISSLLIIKNQLEQILYNDEMPSSEFTTFFKDSSEVTDLNIREDTSQNKLIKNMKIYYYGWTMEGLNKDYIMKMSNIKNLKSISLDEWKLREKDLNYKFYHPSMDMEGKLGKNKLLFENKNFYSKDNINIGIRINKSMSHHLSRMDSSIRYDEDRGRENIYETKSHYLITILQDDNISTFMIPYREYLKFFEEMNEVKYQIQLKNPKKTFINEKIKVYDKEVEYKEKLNKDVRNSSSDYFSFNIKISDFNEIFKEFEISSYLQKPEFQTKTKIICNENFEISKEDLDYVENSLG